MLRAFFALFAAVAVAALGPGCSVSAHPAASRRVVISEHGAVGDGMTLNTKAIQSVIDDCAKSGGGTIVVPAGVFVTGSIFLKQGVNLCVEKGGVLKGSQNTNDYPWINTRIAGFEMKWPAALVNADGVTNLQLSGEGTLDGSGERWWHEYGAARAAEPNDIDPHFKIGRPRLVHIIRSTNISVRDLLMKDSAFWNLQLTYCDGIEVNHLTVRAPSGAASSDGIDIDSSRNVLITGCDIVCDDDAICLKSGRDADGLRVNRPTENVEIRNCHVGHAGGLVVFGSETSGGIRHVRVHDCKADDGCGEVVRFKTRMGRGGVVEDVIYENIEADDVRQVFGFNMDAFGTTWVPEQFRTLPPASIGTPIFRDITVRNLKAKNCSAAGHIVGLVESPIENLKLENIEIENAEKGFTLRNIRGLVCDNVKVNGKEFDAPDDLKLAKDKTDKIAN
jgi:exo-poly-alpha-galacturonosidase